MYDPRGPQGTEVKAIADGRVLLADWLQGYGLVVVVEHGEGDMSLYGYNQSALVNVGQQVGSWTTLSPGRKQWWTQSAQRSILKLDATEKQSTQFAWLGR